VWVGPKAFPSYPVGSERGDLRLPKRFVRLTKCLFSRNTDILEEVMVVAFGDLIKRAALARALHPTLDGCAQQDDQPFDLCISIAWRTEQPDLWADARVVPMFPPEKADKVLPIVDRWTKIMRQVNG